MFKTNRLELGDVQENTPIPIFFEYDGLSRKEVKSATAGCGGCTTNVKIEHNGIRATYTPQRNHGYPKTITLLLDPQKYSGLDGNGNPKNRVVLEFYANVI